MGGHDGAGTACCLYRWGHGCPELTSEVPTPSLLLFLWGPAASGWWDEVWVQKKKCGSWSLGGLGSLASFPVKPGHVLHFSRPQFPQSLGCLLLVIIKGFLSEDTQRVRRCVGVWVRGERAHRSWRCGPGTTGGWRSAHPAFLSWDSRCGERATLRRSAWKWQQRANS